MVRVSKEIDHRVVVELTNESDRGLSYVDLAEEVIDEILDRIDCDNIVSIHYEYDSVDVCSYCGKIWVEDSNGQPMCCEKASCDDK